MKQEEKDLLLKDLSARLPYHVRVKIWLEDGTTEEGPLDLEYNYADVLLDAFYYNNIKNIKPYLRPMSSMIHDEDVEYQDIMSSGHYKCPSEEFCSVIDFLNEHHFDYRGLIDKGLALEAPKGMYNIKEK